MSSVRDVLTTHDTTEVVIMPDVPRECEVCGKRVVGLHRWIHRLIDKVRN